MITLQEYSANVQDKIDTSAIIDELRKSNALLEALTFDDTVTATGGSFAYGYVRKTQESGAAFRKVGEEYEKSDAKKETKVSNVAILGGEYEIDRAIANASANTFADERDFQATEKVKAVKATFNNAVINGVGGEDNADFEGLDSILKGTATEYTSEVDVSTSALMDANYSALDDEIAGVMAEMDGEADFILVNTKMKNKLVAMAKRLGQYQVTMNEVGAKIEKYGNTTILDMGAKCGSNDPVIAIAEDGTTDIYFVRLGRDGFHGITLNGKMFDIVTPEFGVIGATKVTGLVEMYAGTVLKSTKAAAVLRGVKVGTPKAQG